MWVWWRVPCTAPRRGSGQAREWTRGRRGEDRVGGARFGVLGVPSGQVRWPRNGARARPDWRGQRPNKRLQLAAPDGRSLRKVYLKLRPPGPQLNRNSLGRRPELREVSPLSQSLPDWMAEVLAAEIAALPPELKVRWQAVRVQPTYLVPDVIVVAMSGPRILGYDTAEEEFGTGNTDSSGQLVEWGTWGEHLAWALPHL